MTKMTHTHCIRNFLLGFGSILNIAPVVSTATLPQIDGQKEAEQLVGAAWNEVGAHLTQTIKSGGNHEQQAKTS
ncbi:hypothetical protein NYR78_03010 [Actinobacillus equuli subsp. haemolyticus]|nr:hypothetical protein NYR78_03010 [Actinobacillus equuli subsp. haemolyticus]